MLTPRLRAAWVMAVIGTAGIALVSGAIFVLASAFGGDKGKAAVDVPWQQSIAWPTGVRRTAERGALIAYDVPAGHPDCVRNPRVQVTGETAKAVQVSLTYELSRPDCTATERGTIAVTTRWALRSRSIVVNGEVWSPGPAGYLRCTGGCPSARPELHTVRPPHR
jgi:hypothetical protein